MTLPLPTLSPNIEHESGPSLKDRLFLFRRAVVSAFRLCWYGQIRTSSPMVPALLTLWYFMPFFALFTSSAGSTLMNEQIIVYGAWLGALIIATVVSSTHSQLWNRGGLSVLLASEGISPLAQMSGIAASVCLMCCLVYPPVFFSVLIRSYLDVGTPLPLIQLLDDFILFCSSLYTISLLSSALVRILPTLSITACLIFWFLTCALGQLLTVRMAYLPVPLNEICLWLFCLIPPFDLAFQPARILFFWPADIFVTILISLYLILYVYVFAFIISRRMSY